MAETSSMRRTLASNAMSLFGAHFAAKALSFGLIVILPRYVTDAELGGWFLAIAVTNLLGAIAELGMRDPVIRQLHLRPEEASRTLGVALAFRATMSVAVLASCGLVVLTNRYPPDVARLIGLLGVAEALNGIAQLFYFVFRARERMDLEARSVLLERAIVVFVGGALVIAGFGRMTLLGWVAMAAAIMNACASGFAVRRWLSTIRLSFAFAEWSRLWKSIAPFALANALGFLYYRLDTILLERWSAQGASAVAWYGIAYSWVMALTVFPGAALGSAFPHLARLGSPDADATARRDFDALYTRAWKLMLAVGPAVAIGTAFTARDFVKLVYPDALYPSGTVDAALARLAWVEGLLFLSAIVSNTLRALNRRRAIVCLVAATVVINVAANAWAIPRYNHVGAATALIASETFFVVAGTLMLRKSARLTEWGFLPKLAVGYIGLAVFLHATSSWGLFERVAVASGLFALFLAMAGVIRRGDWTLAERANGGP